MVGEGGRDGIGTRLLHLRGRNGILKKVCWKGGSVNVC